MRSSMGACYIYNGFWHILSEINVLHYDIRAISTIRVYAADAHCRCKKIVKNLNFKISNMNMSIKIKYLKNYKDFPFSNWIDQKKLDNYILPTFTKKIVRYLQNN